MKEIKGNIWDMHDIGHWIVITTNGIVRKDGACVMGRGVALQAKEKYPDLPYRLGRALRAAGNNVHTFEDLRIITLPVKRHWRYQALPELIERSLKQLLEVWTGGDTLYMVRPGCANGGLDWETQVKPLCEKYLDDRFVIVEWST